MTAGGQGISGTSSTTHGYASGAENRYTVIDKFNFSTEANGTDVGDLTSNRGDAAGSQY